MRTDYPERAGFPTPSKKRSREYSQVAQSSAAAAASKIQLAAAAAVSENRPPAVAELVLIFCPAIAGSLSLPLSSNCWV